MKKCKKYMLTRLAIFILLFSACKKNIESETFGRRPPVAIAGADTTITLPSLSAVLDAGKSYDPDGTPLVYEWKILNGPGSSYILKPNSAVTKIVNLEAGAYSIELLVTNKTGIGLSSKDTLLITVLTVGPNNAPPKADAGQDITIMLPRNSVSLNGTGTDPDNNISSYTWAKIAGAPSSSINNATTNNGHASVNGLEKGTYQFELKVTDLGGLFSKDTVQVNVVPFSPAPPDTTHSIANAGSDQTITLPLDSTWLDGSASLWANTASTFNWSKLSGPSQYTIATSSFQYDFYNKSSSLLKNLVPGIYFFQLTVTTPYGKSNDTVKIEVKDDPQNLNTVTYYDVLWSRVDDVFASFPGIYMTTAITGVRGDFASGVPNSQVLFKMESSSTWIQVFANTCPGFGYDVNDKVYILKDYCINTSPNSLYLIGQLCSIKLKL